MNNRLARLESKAAETHTLAWETFFVKFRQALDSVPAGALERFGPVDLDELDGLEDTLAPWDSWADRVLPLLERSQDDLTLWPADLPCPPGDAKRLLLELVSRWRRNPRLPLAALAVLLALAVAVEGEGGTIEL